MYEDKNCISFRNFFFPQIRNIYDKIKHIRWYSFLNYSTIPYTVFILFTSSFSLLETKIYVGITALSFVFPLASLHLCLITKLFVKILQMPTWKRKRIPLQIRFPLHLPRVGNFRQTNGRSYHSIIFSTEILQLWKALRGRVQKKGKVRFKPSLT